MPPNLYQRNQTNTSESRVSRHAKVSLAALLFLLLIAIISSALSWLVQIAIFNPSGGLADAAFALVVGSITTFISFVVSALIIAGLLKRANLKGAFATAVYTGLSLIPAYYLIGASSLPRWLLMIVYGVLIVILFNLFYAWFGSGARRNPIFQYGLPIVIVVVAFFVLGVISTQHYLKAGEERVVKRSFEIYGDKNTSQPDVNAIRRASRGETPYAYSYLSTPDGYIKIYQAAYDDAIKQYVSLPNQCDQDGFSRYIKPGPSPQEAKASVCHIVSQNPEGTRALFISEGGERKYGKIPYGAIINGTAFSFSEHGYPKPYYGTSEAAAQYILNFLAEAEPVSTEELLREK